MGTINTVYNAYTTVKKSDGTYQWIPITSETGAGPAPYLNTPYINGDGSAGTSEKYSMGDHIHPSDSAKQDILVSGVNIKTVNGEDILTSGNITPVAGGTGDDNVIESVSENGSALPISSKNVSMTLKTVEGQDLLGSGNITVTPKKLYYGDTYYDGTVSKTISIYDGSYSLS